MANITKEEYKRIVAILEQKVLLGGGTVTEIVKETGISDTNLCWLRTVYFGARKDDIKTIIDAFRGRRIGYAAFEAIYEHIGKPMPDELVKEKEQREEENREKRRNEWTPERRAQQSEALKNKWGKSDEATPIWAQTMLLNQAKLISQLDELMDAVIPKYARDVVESNEKLDTHLVQLINKLS